MTDDVSEYRAAAREWLSDRRGPRDARPTGERSYAIFHHRDEASERALIDDARRWQAERFDAGYGAITAPVEDGGAGLDPAYARAYATEERDFDVPARHELLEVTIGMVAPTVAQYGSSAQRDRFVRAFLRADSTCCQLFSEPGAGSDLAAVATRARRDGDDWIVDGQKVWTSGAQFADWGFLIARSEPDSPKHAGLTAFFVDLAAPGVDIRPIRQMSGGSSFNEVFLTGVRVPDALRIGERGQGWPIALTLLGHERSVSGASTDIGANAADLVRIARALDTRADDPVAERLGEALARDRGAALTQRWHAEREAAGEAISGSEASATKLVWSQNLTLIGDVAADILGPMLAADTGVSDAFALSEHVLGAPGFHIAGGSDQIQRGIIGERGLGLPREPRAAARVGPTAPSTREVSR